MYDDARGDSGSDKVAAQLESLFALALADEPESTVTAASVLREVRAESEEAAARWTFGDWLRAGGWKWGGALVAAAALVGAVIVLPSTMGGAGSDSATAGASAEMAQSYDGADEGAAGDTGSDDSASGQAYSMADADAGAADEAGAASADSAQAAAEAPSADMAAESGDGSVEESAEMPAERNGDTEEGGSDEATGEEPEIGGPEMTAMPPLTDRQWDAAVAALPAGTTVTAQSLGGNPGGVAGNLLVLSGGGSIQVVVERTGGTETFIDAQGLRDNGYLVADDETGGVRVTAAADPEAQSSVSQADLDRMAAAVRGAS